jgi:hypothetical protein
LCLQLLLGTCRPGRAGGQARHDSLRRSLQSCSCIRGAPANSGGGC